MHVMSTASAREQAHVPRIIHGETFTGNQLCKRRALPDIGRSDEDWHDSTSSRPLQFRPALNIHRVRSVLKGRRNQEWELERDRDKAESRPDRPHDVLRV